MRESWNRRTDEEIKKITCEIGYKLVENYFSGKYRRVVVEDEYGYKYDVFLSNLVRNKKTSFVGNGNPFSIHNISVWIKINKKPFELFGDNYFKTAKSKLFFKCLNKECGESFDVSWNNIYSKGYGCPYCSGKRVNGKNNLFNLRPDLILDWDFNKNIDSPNTFTEHSGKKVWWLCHVCKNSWKAHINRRSYGTLCPNCSLMSKDSLIAVTLKKHFKENFNSFTEYRIFKNPETSQWLPYDIYIPYGENPQLNGFYIEVHGEQHYKLNSWHKLISKKNSTTPEEEFEYQKWKDKLKKKFAKKNGYYIEVDISKFKNPSEAIAYTESKLRNFI